MSEPIRYNKRDCRDASNWRIVLLSFAVLAMVAMTSLFRAGAAECSDLETETRKEIALVRADDGVAHVLETRDGALASEAPLTGNSKLENAIGI